MEEMNNAEYDLLDYNKKLEIIAMLVEAKAKTIEEAVAIIRDCKLKP